MNEMESRWPSMGGTVYPEFVAAGDCPEHGDLCHAHVDIGWGNGLTQILRDPKGQLSPELYTIKMQARRLKKYREVDVPLLEEQVDGWARQAALAGADTRKRVACLEPDWIVHFDADGSVEKLEPVSKV